MVIIKTLLMEGVSIVIQHPSNVLYPVVKGQFRFRPPKFTQKLLNAGQKILWPEKLLSSQCRLHVPEQPEVRRWMRCWNNIIFREKVLGGLCAAAYCHNRRTLCSL
jgi:hypothetical protein